MGKYRRRELVEYRVVAEALRRYLAKKLSETKGNMITIRIYELVDFLRDKEIDQRHIGYIVRTIIDICVGRDKILRDRLNRIAILKRHAEMILDCLMYGLLY